MKIGIDARMLGPTRGGLGRYVEELVRHLESSDQENDYVIFLRRNNWDRYTPVSTRFTKALADIPWYGWREQIKLPALIKRERVDLMHWPHWNVPYVYNEPFVVTIHDLLLMHYPTRAASTLGPVGYWFKNMAYRRVIRHAAEKASHIITTSEFTRKNIQTTLGVPVEKITVTYQAPFVSNENLNAGLTSSTAKEATVIKNKFGINKPYVLYVGVAYPHKNLPGLMRAWQMFEAKYHLGYQLVLVGKENYFYKQLRTDPMLNKLKGSIIFTDFVDDQELAVLYDNASLYVFPSLYEGFGLPPLEAMAHGVPVISSNRTCLPEVLSDAVLYFDPAHLEEIVEALYSGMTNEALRRGLRDRGYGLLKRYSWDKLAAETRSVYARFQRGS